MQTHKTTLWFKKADKISNLICFAQSMQYPLSFSARSEYPLRLVLSGPMQDCQQRILLKQPYEDDRYLPWFVSVSAFLFLSPFPSSLVSLLSTVLPDRTSS